MQLLHGGYHKNASEAELSNKRERSRNHDDLVKKHEEAMFETRLRSATQQG